MLLCEVEIFFLIFKIAVFVFAEFHYLNILVAVDSSFQTFDRSDLSTEGIS